MAFDFDHISIMEFMPAGRIARASKIDLPGALKVLPLQFTLTDIEMAPGQYGDPTVVIRFHAEVLERRSGKLIPITYEHMVLSEQYREDPRGIVRAGLALMFFHELDELLVLNGQHNDPHAGDAR